jgi:iron(III) transport system substrate-binding protein
MLSGKDEEQKAAASKMGLFWPNQEGRGAHVNVSGVGMTVAARNSENALKLMEYLVGEEAQRWYAEVNHEYPVREGVAWSEILESWGEFKADTLNLSRLGELNGDAVRLMDRAGWK